MDENIVQENTLFADDCSVTCILPVAQASTKKIPVDHFLPQSHIAQVMPSEMRTV